VTVSVLLPRGVTVSVLLTRGVMVSVLMSSDVTVSVLLSHGGCVRKKKLLMLVKSFTITVELIFPQVTYMHNELIHLHSRKQLSMYRRSQPKVNKLIINTFQITNKLQPYIHKFIRRK
jgi:hypothetical protein